MKPQNPKYLLLHILGCLLFMAQPIIVPIHPPNEVDFLYSSATLRDFIGNAILLGFFYSNYYYFIPRFYFRERYVMYSGFIVAGLLIITFVPSFVTGMGFMHEPPPAGMPPIGPPGGDHLPHHQSAVSAFLERINHQIFLFVAVVSFSLMNKIRNRWFQTEKEKQAAEISYLLSQINPHFLFNALNSIYALNVKEKAEHSSEATLKLSGLMRYILTETSSDAVRLDTEIAHIEDFIDLQKLRLDKSIRFHYECTGHPSGAMIAPLLLIPFIENAFKYGVNPDAASEIDIRIDCRPDRLQLDVKNKKVMDSISKYEKTGIGVKNTRSRLLLLYPSKHHLSITEAEDTYHVHLIIDLI